MMKIGILHFLIPTLLLFGGCIRTKPVTVRSVRCCKLVKARNSDPELTFRIELENPNGFNITIKEYDLEIRMNGSGIGRVSDIEPFVLSPNSVVTKTLNIRATAKQLAGIALLMGMNALLNNDSAAPDVEIAGSVVAKAKGVSRRVKVSESYPIELNP